MNPPTSAYYRHRFPSRIISHCGWLYFRFTFSFRDVEEMMNEHGVTVTYESVRGFFRKLLKGLQYVPPHIGVKLTEPPERRVARPALDLARPGTA